MRISPSLLHFVIHNEMPLLNRAFNLPGHPIANEVAVEAENEDNSDDRPSTAEDNSQLASLET